MGPGQTVVPRIAAVPEGWTVIPVGPPPDMPPDIASPVLVPPRPGELPKNLPPPEAFGLPPEAAHGLRPEMLGYPSADGKTPAPLIPPLAAIQRPGVPMSPLPGVQTGFPTA